MNRGLWVIASVCGAVLFAVACGGGRPGPLEGLQPTQIQPGQEVSVAVYADTEASPETCMDLLPHMIPATAVGEGQGKVVSCNVGLADPARLLFRQSEDGTLYLSEVIIVSLGTADLPTNYQQSPCRDIVEFLLPAGADPSTAANNLTCTTRPQVKGKQDDAGPKVWASLPVDSPVTTFPDNVHCWELVRYLGQPRGAEGFGVPCFLD